MSLKLRPFEWLETLVEAAQSLLRFAVPVPVLAVSVQVLTGRQTALTMPFKLHKSPFKLEISQDTGIAAHCVRDSRALQTKLI